ncbi:MAG: hypothetical protein HXN90_04325 [Prevotella pallens]|nr:hypothetical protein [Prevotella pallens]
MEKCRNTKVFCASPIFMSHKHRIITYIYCIIANPLAHFGNLSAAVGVCFVAHFVGVRHVIGYPSAALSQSVSSILADR